MAHPQPHSTRRSPLLVVLFLALVTVWLALALFPAAPAQASGVVTDCTSPNGANGFYTKLGGGGLVTFNCPFPGPTVITISGAGGIQPAGNTTVDGTNNGHRITLSGGHTNRLFHQLSNGGTLTLMHLTLRDGYESADVGGCLLNESGTALIDVLMTNCMTSVNGGGIFSSGALTVTTSSLDGNAAGKGGGLYTFGAAKLSQSSVSGNQANTECGGIYNKGELIMSQVSLSGNQAATDGGGLCNSHNALLQDVTLSGNTTSGNGGGIFNALSGNGASPNITIVNATLGGNAAGFGGGIYNFASASLSNATLHANTAITTGGGILNYGDGMGHTGQFTITNVTFSANSAVYGGGMGDSGQGLALNVTFASNTASGFGGGINSLGGITFQNTMFAKGSFGTNCTLAGPLGGVNNLSDDNSCLIGGGSDNVNLHLGPLANNGGPTLTHMPAPPSPAIDGGSNGVCPLTDQRGALRWAAHTGIACDVGAVEYGALLPRLYLPLIRR